MNKQEAMAAKQKAMAAAKPYNNHPQLRDQYKNKTQQVLDIMTKTKRTKFLKQRKIRNDKKLAKLKQLQVAMIAWADRHKRFESHADAGDTWKERMSYTLKCENRELDVDDIKMLNNLWKAYK